MADNTGTEAQQSGQNQGATQVEPPRDFQRVDTISNSTIKKGEESISILTKIEKRNN